jgi:hypothetical protein
LSTGFIKADDEGGPILRDAPRYLIYPHLMLPHCDLQPPLIIAALR